MNYERHPISASWPDMAEEDFIALKDSINVSGLREPIVLFEGMILDGWHRYSACLEIGAPAEFEDFSDTDPVQYVLDKHTRRPLTLTQRMTAIALMHSWKPRGKPSKSALNADLTSAQLAKAAGGSVRTAEQVKEAITKGSTALVEGMKSGKTSAVKAAAVAKLPKRQQAAALDKPLPKLSKPVEDEGAPDEAEFDSLAAAEKAETMAMRLLLASDEPLADVTEKYKQALLQIEQLTARIVGLQNQSTHQIKTIKSLQAKLKKLEQSA